MCWLFWGVLTLLEWLGFIKFLIWFPNNLLELRFRFESTFYYLIYFPFVTFTLNFITRCLCSMAPRSPCIKTPYILAAGKTAMFIISTVFTIKCRPTTAWNEDLVIRNDLLSCRELSLREPRDTVKWTIVFSNPTCLRQSHINSILFLCFVLCFCVRCFHCPISRPVNMDDFYCSFTAETTDLRLTSVINTWKLSSTREILSSFLATKLL